MAALDPRPIWLLDVDGVLNAVSLRSPDGAWPQRRTGTARAEGRAYRITFAPHLMAGIRDLHERCALEVRWLTTWAYDANRELRALLDLPEFPVVGEPGGPAAWWKLPLAQQVALEERPIIWTDDDLSYSPEALVWLAALPQPTLAIAPEPDVGLRPVDLVTIETFVEDCRRRT